MSDFGYFLSSEELGPTEMLQYGQTAENVGFERLWLSDHYHPWLVAQGESPFVWSVLGALAATTSVHLTTAVTCPTTRIHPAVLAQATATTQLLADGRFTFGIGTGERLNEHILGDPWPVLETRLERVEEAVEIIRALWTGETLTHRGEHYIVETATLHSRPPEPPPILMSAFGPIAAGVAARIADGLIAVEPDADLLANWRKEGGKGRTQAGVKICWDPDADRAAEIACERWGHEIVGGPIIPELAVPEHFQAVADTCTPEKIAESIPCGDDPGRAADAIREFVDAGFDEVYIGQMGPRQEEAMRFLVDDVLPRV